MPMKPIEMDRLLKKHGFIVARQNGSHRFYFNPNTKKTTIVPIHAQELKLGTEQKILKDAGLK